VRPSAHHTDGFCGPPKRIFLAVGLAVFKNLPPITGSPMMNTCNAGCWWGTYIRSVMEGKRKLLLLGGGWLLLIIKDEVKYACSR
jgi:hypothetical protein